MAETGPIIPPATGVISGVDPRTGERFVNQLMLGATGGAGTPVTDGFLTMIHSGNAGLSRQDSVEVDELHHPMIIVSRRLIVDSDGAGMYRGASSVEVEFGPTEDCTMTVIYASDGTVNPAEGAFGGGNGACAAAYRRNLDGTLTTLPACHSETLRPGETIISHSSGGGGYGDPKNRDPHKVLHDVREGLVTVERASSVYGVALSASAVGSELVIDEARTQALRAVS